jgi:hypothetical protein
MENTIEIRFESMPAVAVPPDDARWLAGELRRAVGEHPETPAVTAAQTVERALNQLAGTAVFTPEEASAVVAQLSVQEATLSQPIRALLTRLIEALDRWTAAKTTDV